ncbi:MAG: hypothetical protein ACUVUG_02460 [Candidatus Aminicenantia bacterium]
MRLKTILLFVVILYSIAPCFELTAFYGWKTDEKIEFRGIAGGWKIGGSVSAEFEGAIFGKDEKSILGGIVVGSRVSDVFPYIFMGTGWKDMKKEDGEKMDRYWSYGGGVKLRIFEKLWLRIDYRNMRFSSQKLYRLYGGLTYIFNKADR